MLVYQKAMGFVIPNRFIYVNGICMEYYLPECEVNHHYPDAYFMVLVAITFAEIVQNRKCETNHL
jgi:hypothetical protein